MTFLHHNTCLKRERERRRVQIASFPGLSTIQFLLKWRGKAWSHEATNIPLKTNNACVKCVLSIIHVIK